MAVFPDFDAMLASIVGQPACPAEGQCAAQAAVGDAAATPAVSAAQAASIGAMSTATASYAVGGGIVAAVTAGCQGMADRRLQRGDNEGAVFWNDIAAGNDESVC